MRACVTTDCKYDVEISLLPHRSAAADSVAPHDPAVCFASCAAFSGDCAQATTNNTAAVTATRRMPCRICKVHARSTLRLMSSLRLGCLIYDAASVLGVGVIAGFRLAQARR